MIAQFITNSWMADAGLMFVGLLLLLFLGIAIAFKKFYIKVGPDEAIVRSGQGGLHVDSGDGMRVVPMIH